MSGARSLPLPLPVIAVPVLKIRSPHHASQDPDLSASMHSQPPFSKHAKHALQLLFLCLLIASVFEHLTQALFLGNEHVAVNKTGK